LVTLDVWEQIRLRCLRNGEPVKLVARELGISKNTVKKYIQSQSVPVTKPLDRRSAVDVHKSFIDDLLRESPSITSKRVGVLLRERVDASVSIGERALRRYVASRRAELKPREAFVRASYSPGAQAQFDFTPVQVIVAGILVTLELFVMRLSYSGRIFARASFRCDQPALFAGILEALVTFGGVPLEGVFDNAATAVARVLRGRSRDENATFRSFCGALAFPIVFAAPRKGNEKGGVEGANHYVQENFFTPIPEFDSLDQLNEQLAAFCDRDQLRIHSTHREAVAERFAREESVLRPLPNPLPRPCVVRPAHVNKFSEVVFETNRYSVPTRFAHRSALIEVYDRRLRIVVDETAAAEHPRLSDRHQNLLDPRHFVDLLSHKHRAADTALVFAGDRLPKSFADLRRQYILKDSTRGTRAWMDVVSLLKEAPVDAVDGAIRKAMELGTDDPAAIALLVRQHATPATLPPVNLEGRPDALRHLVDRVDLQAWNISALAERAS
jgi:transposase